MAFTHQVTLELQVDAESLQLGKCTSEVLEFFEGEEASDLLLVPHVEISLPESQTPDVGAMARHQKGEDTLGQVVSSEGC